MRMDLMTPRSAEECREALRAALTAGAGPLRGQVRDDNTFHLHGRLGMQLGTVITGEIRPLERGAHVQAYVGIGQVFYVVGMGLLILAFIEPRLLALAPVALAALWAFLMRNAAHMRRHLEALLRAETASRLPSAG